MTTTPALNIPPALLLDLLRQIEAAGDLDVGDHELLVHHRTRPFIDVIHAAYAAGHTQPGAPVIAEIIAERQAQDARWGEQNHPDGTGPDTFWSFGGPPASRIVISARNEAQTLAATGDLTWLAILHEETAEAFAESDPGRLRAELVQVAAVAAAWIEAIDRRTTTEETTAS